MDSYVTVSTLAVRTETSESFWRKAIARRALPVHRFGGARLVRIKISDAERFLGADSGLERAARSDAKKPGC
jgi:excisionase family DNA binding protein